MCTSQQFMSLRGHFYLPPMKLQKGNVLQVSVCPQGGWGRCTPTGRYPLPEMATAVDGTHPTGMHSCYTCLSAHRGKGGMISLPAWSHVLRGVRWGRGSVSRESLPLGGDQVLAFWHKWHFGTSSRRTLMPEGQWPSVISTGLL